MGSNQNSEVWVGELNRHGRFSRPPVKFYDTTLRDGEQSVGVVLDPRQKLAIARLLDEIGVERIEAGFPLVSKDDAEAFRLISSAGLRRAEVWGFARAVKSDVDELIRLGARGAVIESPTSDLKLAAYGVSRETLLSRVAEAVGHAKRAGIIVAFFAVDSTRSDLDFLRKVYTTALDAGAAEIVVVDTIGAAGPEAVAYLLSEVRSWIGPDIPLHFHGHNDFGMATACAVAAVRAGADWIQATVNGMGERAGNADLAEVALALRCLYGIESALDLTRIREVSRYVAGASGYTLEDWKPLVGRNLFVRESGAVASQFHLPDAIEPYAASLVGAASERRVVLGKKSGLDNIDIKARELSLDVLKEKRGAILAAVKQRGIAKRGLLTDEEFREIVARC